MTWSTLQTGEDMMLITDDDIVVGSMKKFRNRWCVEILLSGKDLRFEGTDVCALAFIEGVEMALAALREP